MTTVYDFSALDIEGRETRLERFRGHFLNWYDTQSGGQSAHSPRTCIPGGGWKITEMYAALSPVIAAFETAFPLT